MFLGFFSLRNLSLSKVGKGEVELLWALIFLTMILRINRIDTTEIEREKTKKTKGKLQVSTKKITVLYDA